jgi:hypothetical protein
MKPPVEARHEVSMDVDITHGRQQVDLMLAPCVENILNALSIHGIMPYGQHDRTCISRGACSFGH